VLRSWTENRRKAGSEVSLFPSCKEQDSKEVTAADFFSLNFEKPAVNYSDVRPPVAQQIFSELGS
jgi:hypothetical protein